MQYVLCTTWYAIFIMYTMQYVLYIYIQYVLYNAICNKHYIYYMYYALHGMQYSLRSIYYAMCNIHYVQCHSRTMYNEILRILC